MRATLANSFLAASIAAFGIGLAGTAAIAAPATFACDPGHTDIRFSWKHAGFSTQSAGFRGPECKLVLDPADPGKATLSVKIKVDSLATGVADLDKHLRSAEFFDIEKFPEITFESTAVKVTDKSADVEGNLTIKGVSKPATLKVNLVNIGDHPVGAFFDYFKGQWAGFDATTTIKRSDFGMAAMVPVGSDEVTVAISTEMKAQ